VVGITLEDPAIGALGRFELEIMSVVKAYKIGWHKPLSAATLG
jgi:hypothetical protein